MKARKKQENRTVDDLIRCLEDAAESSWSNSYCLRHRQVVPEIDCYDLKRSKTVGEEQKPCPSGD
jgi:hypothetical protein